MKTSNITIEGLRKTGFKVYVNHISNWHTQIFVTDPQGHTAFGYALCNDQDQPNRKLGNKIALGRALKNLQNKVYCEFSHCASSLDKAIEL